MAPNVDPNSPVPDAAPPNPPKPVEVVVEPKPLPNKEGAVVVVLPNRPPPKAEVPPNRLGAEVVAVWPNNDGADVVVPKRLGVAPVLVFPGEKRGVPQGSRDGLVSEGG